MRHRSHRIFPLVLLLIVVGAEVDAQAGIYNMQSTLSAEPEEGLTGSFGASADWRTGNIDFLQLTATPLARYHSGRHLLVGLASANRRTTRGSVIISRFFEHLRYRYDLSDNALGEVFAQHEFDAVKRVQLRALVGSGPNFSILDSRAVNLNLGISYMFEYEKLQNDGNTDAGAIIVQHRNSTYLVASYQMDERVKLVESAYLQPRLTNFEDFRIQSESELMFQLTESLSFSSSFTLAYDSKPPSTINKLDTTLKSTISYEF